MYKVLLVDDERLTRENMSKTINWNRIGVELLGSCANGYEAIDWVLDNTPDIIITDIKMPKMTGIELIRIVKQLNEEVQFIVFSGYEEFEFIKEVMQEGVKYYLLKPCSEEEIHKVLIKTIEEIEKNKVVNKLIRNEQLNYKKLIEDKLAALDNLKNINSKNEQHLLLNQMIKDNFEKELTIQAYTKYTMRYINMGFIGLIDLTTQLTQMQEDFCKEQIVDLCQRTLEKIMIYERESEHFIEGILRYIEKNLDNSQLTLKGIAENYIFMNVDYVSKSFIKYTGESFSKYITRKRVGKAQMLMESYKDMKICDVAESVGMGHNPRYFSRMFKKHTGYTPKEYRASIKK